MSSVSAGPLFSHHSNSTGSQTKILLGLISHKRQDHESSFTIHPFLFSYSYNGRHDTYHFRLMFLFYLFYIHFNNDSRSWFCLPLLSFFRYKKATTDKQATMWGFLLGGLLGFAFSCAGKIFALSPFFFSYQTGKEERRREFTTILYLYWRLKAGKVDARVLWPFYGKVAWIDEKKGFVEHSVLWPFFRYRYQVKTQKTTLHLVWPFFMLIKSPEKFHLRFLPFTWVKKQNDNLNRGFILLYYWDQNSDKSTWGVFPVFHLKRDSQGVVKTVYAFFMGMYRTSEKSITMMVTPLWWSHWTLDNSGQITSYLHMLLPFFGYANYTPGQDYFSNFTIVVPLCATLVSIRPKDSILNIFVLALVWYYRNDKEQKSYIYGTVYGKYQRGQDQYHSILAVLALWKQSASDIDIWVLGPLIRYQHKGETTKQTTTWFFPLYYVTHDARVALNSYGDYGCTKYTIYVFFLMKIQGQEELQDHSQTPTDGYYVTAFTPDQGTGAYHLHNHTSPSIPSNL
jgi:hypothetical protein